MSTTSPTSITIANRTSGSLSVTYLSSNVEVKTGDLLPLNYTSGNISISNGSNKYLLLESGIKKVLHSYIKVYFFDKIVTATPASSSELYTGSDKITAGNYDGSWNLMVSLSDSIALTNFASDGTWIVDSFSTYFSTNSKWTLYIVMLLIVFIAFCIIAGLVYWKMKKGKNQM